MEDNKVEKRPYSQMKDDQIEIENFSQTDQNQSQEQTRDSEYSQPNQISFRDGPQNFGSNIIFKLNPLTGQPKYTLGPHWPLFVCAWGSFIGVDYALIRMVLNSTDNLFWVILTSTVCFIHITSYLVTAIVNPGLAHKNDETSRNIRKLENITPEQIQQMYCKKCDIMKDQHTWHCDACHVCVRGFDHHCPWSSKCIAQGNIKAFNVFITMTFIFMAYAIVITVTTLLPMNRRSIRRPQNEDIYSNNSTNSTNNRFFF